MYDVKQFKPALYLIVFLGLTGFAMSEETAGLWVVATTLIGINGWLVYLGKFRPLPRLVAGPITILTALYPAAQVVSHEGSPIVAIGQFLVMLQLVKLWEQRANRDYAQLFVLSLLLMVAAAISTGSLLFGLLFIVYLILSLYGALLFHLKIETDAARLSIEPGDDAPTGPAPVFQSDRPAEHRFLSRSMRRLTALVTVYALISAVAVFLLFPRGTGAGMFGQLQYRPRGGNLIGFSEQVSFQSVARIQQNNEVVGTVKITKDGVPMAFMGPLLLRGAVHHDYNWPANGHERSRYDWGTAMDRNRYRDMATIGGGVYMPPEVVDYRTKTHDNDLDEGPFKPHYRAEYELVGTGTPVLFSLPGPVALHVDEAPFRNVHFQYSYRDQAIRSGNPIPQGIRYTIDSTGSLGNDPTPDHKPVAIDPMIEQFARRPDVNGGFVARRDAERAAAGSKAVFTSSVDGDIARSFETYLRTHFSYTLDLTDAAQIQGRDPMVAFLYDFKRGHCEYFAGAMTLLCQSLGMDARMVVGFKCDEFNDFGHFYEIRQSQAHAWVEVRGPDGWQSYDPTSGNDAGPRAATTWQKTKHLFDYLEYSWQNAVVAYNGDNRDNLIQSMNDQLNQTTVRSVGRYYNLRKRLDSLGEWLAGNALGPLIGLLTLGLFGAVAWFFYERYKHNLKIKRIGVETLSADAQDKLIRQLGFYDDLLVLLERHAIRRPPHQTQLEFSQGLTFLPASAYETIGRLTALFYRIRYGRSELDPGRRRRLAEVVQRLAPSLLITP